MSRARWTFVVVIYAAAAAIAYVFLGGVGVPPCFGTVPTGQVTAECYAAWQASLAHRPLLQQLLDTPWGAVALFLLLAATTWAVVRVRARTAVDRSAAGR